MKNIRFICAQPASAYYSWQVEVMLNNFISMGINLNNVDIVCWKVNGVIPENWSRLASGYSARFLFYDDTRKTRHYISSIRPNILKQHFKAFPELENEAILYHDDPFLKILHPGSAQHSGSVCASHPAGPGSIPSVPMLGFNDSKCTAYTVDSAIGLIVIRTHLVLASGKQVLQKNVQDITIKQSIRVVSEHQIR